MIATVVVEYYVASADQQLACGHVVGRHDQLAALRLGDGVTGREVTMCIGCLDAVGKAAQSSTPPRRSARLEP